MSQEDVSNENAEILRRMFAAYNEFGFRDEVAAEFFHEDAVFEEPPNQPGAQVVRGREEVGETFRSFDAAWQEHRSEPQELRPLDRGRVLVSTLDRLVGRDGIEMTPASWHLFTFRAGHVVRWQAFWDEEAALEAAGRPE